MPNSTAIAALSIALFTGACQTDGASTLAEAAAPAPAEAKAAAAPDAAPVAGAAPMLDVLNAAQPYPGILTAGQPTAEQLTAAKEAGYKTVINMRVPGEAGELANESELVEKLGMRYLSLPVRGEEDVNAETAKKLHDALGEDALPALVHCRMSNRVGAIFAVRAHEMQGASKEEALAVGKRGGLEQLEPAVRKALGM